MYHFQFKYGVGRALNQSVQVFTLTLRLQTHVVRHQLINPGSSIDNIVLILIVEKQRVSSAATFFRVCSSITDEQEWPL